MQLEKFVMVGAGSALRSCIVQEGASVGENCVIGEVKRTSASFPAAPAPLLARQFNGFFAFWNARKLLRLALSPMFIRRARLVFRLLAPLGSH
jgi:hypothetical protein